MFEFLALLYALICVTFALETYSEGERESSDWDTWRVIGLGLCILWPVSAVIVLAAAIRSRRAEESARVIVR